MPNLSNLKHAILALFLEKVGSYFFPGHLDLVFKIHGAKKS